MSASIPNDKKFDDSTGSSATFSTQGRIDLTNAFFQDLGSNGRRCVTCHQPDQGWTVTASAVQKVFDSTNGTDPIFRTNDGTNSPTADMSTVAARRAATSMLRTKGLIRVGIAVPASAEFELVAVDDPYGHASSADVSLFRRPLPSTNLKYNAAVMWDGRETFDGQTIHFDLADQANGATQGHAQAPQPISQQTRDEIVAFETGIFTAQQQDNNAGALDSAGPGGTDVTGGADALASFDFSIGINDDLSQPTFNLYDAWRSSGVSAARRSIARGQDIFNTRQFHITNVRGQDSSDFVGTCNTCHDTPNVGNYSVAEFFDIGIADGARRTADLPLYTLRNKTTGETVQTTDPGRALITGKWDDLQEFKPANLRGLAARAPYFHNGSAATLAGVVGFYNGRFQIGLSDQDKTDLVAFLQAL